MHDYTPVKQIFILDLLDHRRKSFDIYFIQGPIDGRNDHSGLLLRLNYSVTGKTGDSSTFLLVEQIVQHLPLLIE